MQQLIYFIGKYKYFLYFLLLQVIALFITINNHSFHRGKFISSTNAISGSLHTKTAEFKEYLNLKQQNDFLANENRILKNKLEKFYYYNDSILGIVTKDSLSFNQYYSYTNGKIKKNEYHKPYNYLIINRGKKHNVTKEMAIVNSKGIIGITDDVSNRYARVQSILNRNSKINARFKHNNYFGTLTWDTHNYSIVQLTDIPRQAKFKVGDTIITGGKSSIFPEGIPIGTVLNTPKKQTASNTIDIKLFNDMSNLGHIYIIKSFHKNEIRQLDKQENE